MSVWNTPLGIGVVDNPVMDSVFVDQFNTGGGIVPQQDGLLTEDGAFILIENGEFLTTE